VQVVSLPPQRVQKNYLTLLPSILLPQCPECLHHPRPSICPHLLHLSGNPLGPVEMTASAVNQRRSLSREVFLMPDIARSRSSYLRLLGPVYFRPYTGKVCTSLMQPVTERVLSTDGCPRAATVFVFPGLHVLACKPDYILANERSAPRPRRVASNPNTSVIGGYQADHITMPPSSFPVAGHGEAQGNNASERGRRLKR
jgi:hypothetical protein